MRVADILEHPRRPGRYLLTLSDERSFTLSASLLADIGATRKGVELNAVAIDKLALESEVLRTMDRAIASLSRGRRTRRDLEQRLRRVKPGFVAPDVAIVATALDQLTDSGVLSDAAVARAEASSRLRRGDAPRRVEMLLQLKGIERGVAADAVLTAVREEEVDVDALCVEVARKRFRTLGKLEPKVARRRLIGFLMRRGYESNSIRLALAELSVPEHFGAR